MNAANRAEPVLDDMLVECIRARCFFGREQLEIFPWHEPHQRPLALADGAVARHCSLDLAFDFKCNPAAMTASFVLHMATPRLNGQVSLDVDLLSFPWGMTPFLET